MTPCCTAIRRVPRSRSRPWFCWPRPWRGACSASDSRSTCRTGASAAGLERLLSSVLIGLTALLTFRLAGSWLGTGGALFVTFVFAYCTSAWSVLSRGLWQHGPSVLLLTAALLAFVRGRIAPRWHTWAGAFVAAAYVMRPTNALAVIVFLGYVAVCHRSSLPRYLLGSAAVAALFFWINQSAYGTWMPGYFQPRSFSLAQLADGAAGTLVSPGRGLFVYSPVLLFSLVGMAIQVRERAWTGLDTAMAIIIVGHWLVISSWWSWWGGAVYGPRLLADLLPYFMVFLVPFVARWCRAGRGAQLAWALPLVATLAISFAMHRLGSRCWAVWDWNVLPVQVREHPERLWDWQDAPFLRRQTPLHRSCS